MFEHTTSTILLIEDNPRDADFIQHALLQAEPGLTLDVAKSKEDALTQIDRWGPGQTPPVVILLSLQFPQSGTGEILTTLKSHPLYRIIPVVVLISSNNLADIESAYNAGANSCIMKSTEPEQLYSAVSLIHRYWCKLNIHPE